MLAPLLALVALLAPPLAPSLAPGRYRAEAEGGPIELVLGPDGAAVFGGAPVRWQQVGDVLTLRRAAGAPYVLTIRETDGRLVLDGPPFGRLRLEAVAPADPSADVKPAPAASPPPSAEPSDPTPPAATPPVTAPPAAPPAATPPPATPPAATPPAAAPLPAAPPTAEAPRPLALIGAWRYRASGGALVLRLYGDGRYAIEQPGAPETTGRWDADGERLTLTPTGGEPLTYTARRDDAALVIAGGDLPAAVRFVPDTPQ